MLVDGMSLLFRGFYATGIHGNFMFNPQGVPTNGLFGFMQYLLDAVQQYEPSHVICCWDTPQPTFRHQLYTEYKANRGEPPLELLPQFTLVQPLVEQLGILNMEKPGFEADDLIGTLSANYGQDMEVQILTSDRDSLQLIDEQVHAIIMKRGFANYKRYTIEALQEEVGLQPAQIIDLKALMGDASDNYPGVRGVGEKTALKLLTQFHSIDHLLANLDEVSKGVRQKIEQDLEMLQLSRQLATIKCDIPLSVQLEEARWQGEYMEMDRNTLWRLLQEIPNAQV